MTEKSKLKQIHPEKYREFGLTVGLCACVQENAGIPERSCDCCYGTGISVYTHIDIPAPTNCPHWINDQIYVKGFRCALYRDVGRDIRDTTIRKEERERVLDEVFSSMDIFFGDIPMDSNIIKWAVSKQDSFVTAAMACYLHSRKLRSESRECPR